jgi:hypothetical protein
VNYFELFAFSQRMRRLGRFALARQALANARQLHHCQNIYLSALFVLAMLNVVRRVGNKVVCRLWVAAVVAKCKW